MLNNTLKPNFIACDSSLAAADLVLLGIPFDGTVSFRAGSRMGPNAIRSESAGLETYSPYQNSDLTQHAIHDLGDLELPYGNTGRALSIIEATVADLVGMSKKVLCTGGEHLITLPIIKALHAKHPGLHVIQFDAHADLRSDYLGVKLSHATIIRRVWEIVGDNKIWQFGIRSGTREEFAWSAEGHTIMEKFTADSVKKAANVIGDQPVYLTLDIDILDTSVVPGTGTPEPGGLQFNQLLQAIMELSQLNIVGADLVELAPQLDISGASTAVACKLLREIMLLMLSSKLTNQ